MQLQSLRTQWPATPAEEDVVVRPPTAEDGPAVWEFIKSCGPLDDNSMYCNLLQCTHFADTCALAVREDDEQTPVGWISAYIPPQEPRTLFVWQVAVCASTRGSGLGTRLVQDVLARDACAPVRRLRATITADNQASWGLFGGIAENLGAELKQDPWLRREDHFGGAHDTEHLVTIGPIQPARLAAA